MSGEFDPAWRFEAFRRYIVYERIQQAASVLNLYKGERITSANPKIDEMQELLQKRTGEPWKPDRESTEDIRVDIEGTFYRNKGRLLTSLLILKPKQLQEGEPTIQLTEFGKAVARGEIARDEFNREIVQRYQFPHPAYDKNWEEWTKVDRILKPFVYILQILVKLYKKDRGLATIETDDLAKYAYPKSNHQAVGEIADQIEEGGSYSDSLNDPSKSVTRKINDSLGFLCVSGYTYYDGRDVGLNLMGVHPEEGTYFWEKRTEMKNYVEANRLQEIEELIDEAPIDP
jgi:hypothetical protein